MADTKLSNVRGIQEIAGSIPAELEKYTKEAFDEVSGVGEKSVYYSKMNAAGMTGYIFLLILGIGTTTALLLFRNKLIDSLMLVINKHGFKTLLKIIDSLKAEVADVSDFTVAWLNIAVFTLAALGVVMAIVAIHGICRKVYSSGADSIEDKISKTTGYFREQYQNNLLQESFMSRIYSAVENEEDMVLSESGSHGDRLYNTVTKIKSRSIMLTRLTLITRIVIPALLFGGAIYVLYEGRILGVLRMLLAFVLMIICNSELGKLMEFKVNKPIRFVLCLPTLAYGAFLGLFIRDNMDLFTRTGIFGWGSYDLNKLFDELPGLAVNTTKEYNYVHMIIVVAVIQVVALILSIVLRNYRGEKQKLVEGIPANGSGRPRSKGYLIFRIVTHILFMVVFMCANMYTGTATAYIIFIGILWRLVSPLWPTSISKTVSRYWGVAYTIAVALMELTVLLTMLSTCFTFVVDKVVFMIYAMIVSWIAFAGLVMLGRRIKG